MSRTISGFYSKIAPDEWAAIEEFVKDALRQMNLPDSSAARRLYPATVRLAHWAWRTAGYALDHRVIFRRSVITAFIAHGCPDLRESTRSTYRSHLFRMSAKLSDDKRITPQESINTGHSNASQPYTGKEITSLRHWAKNQTTHYRSVNARVLLALGPGAGLTNTEIIHLKAGDVTIDDEGVLLHVRGARERTVPMLAEWEEVPATIARAAMRKDMFIFTPRRGASTYEKTVTGFIEDSTPHNVRLTAQRMRATWVVAHMHARVPARVIADAAGIKHVEALTSYAAFIPDVDPRTVRAWLRGLEASPTGE